MTRREFTGWFRDWWQVAAIGLLIVAWVVRVEAAVNSMGTLYDAQHITESLARLECLRDRTRATLAGVPCGQLLQDWGLR